MTSYRIGASGYVWRNAFTQAGLLSLLIVGAVTTPALFLFSGSPVLAQTTASRSVLKVGSQGADVTELQAALKLLGYYSGKVDGVFGDNTAVAVGQFQKSAGLEADGIVGPATWNRLFPTTANVPDTSAKPAATPARNNGTTTARPATPTATPSPTPTAANSVNLPVLKLGMYGSAVSALQERLRVAGFYKGTVDGVFGVDTQNAVKAAQKHFKLEPDGVVGPATWSALLR